MAKTVQFYSMTALFCKNEKKALRTETGLAVLKTLLVDFLDAA